MPRIDGLVGFVVLDVDRAKRVTQLVVLTHELLYNVHLPLPHEDGEEDKGGNGDDD